MALLKGKFVSLDEAIQSNNDPSDSKDLSRKSYVDSKAASEAAAAVAAIDLSAKADLVGGKVPSTQLPSYVDDVIEVADYASLPGSGETGKIYVTIDNNKVYRWSGSAYIEIVASPGSTDAVPEGTTNLYYTDARAKAAAISDAIVDGVTDKGPSQNAVFDALALKQASLGTGTTSQYLRGDLTWQAIAKAAKVYTVGVDANTIAGCIALCSSPTLSNNYIIEIPPGNYTENLTIPGNVHLKGLANSSDSLSVKITGQHTITGASANGLNNRVAIANIFFFSTHATTPTMTISGVADTEVQVTGCFFDHTATATTSKIFSLGLFGKLYINASRLRHNGTPGQGGTHFTIAAGGSLYTQYGLDVAGGTCVIDMTGQAYSQLTYAVLNCNGASAIKIAANGFIVSQASSITNEASNGHGVNILGANGSFFAAHCVFNVQENAASYVVTGVVGSAFGYYANSYSHITGVVTRNVKIGPNVSQLHYAGSLTSVDINDFQTAARTAAVADAINDGTTNVAPSQNAVFDALALKAAVSHTHTAANITDFTSAAKTAVVDDAIVDGVTDKAASQNAVYDALAGKQASLGTGTTSQYLRGDLTWATVPAALSPKKETFVLTSTDLSNQYLDCAFSAAADSMLVMTGGIPHQEGASEDYTLSVVGGVTRISINAGLLAKLSVGDRVYVMYQK